MRFLSRVVLVAVALMLLWFPPAVVAGQSAQVVTRIAKVGNMIITQTDIDRRAQKILPMQVSFHGGIDKEKIAEIKQNALDGLISRAYKVQYAIDGEISIDATDFENEWKKKLSKNSRLADNVHTAQATKIKADLYLDTLARQAEIVAVEEAAALTTSKPSSCQKCDQPALMVVLALMAVWSPVPPIIVRTAPEVAVIGVPESAEAVQLM